MIVNDRINNVEVSGVVDSVTSAISVTGKSFRVISDGLYKNKIETIVRELCSNAYDSHILAVSKGLIEPTKQFDVHFPSRLEPYFEVRDYGVGMDKEFMLTTFTRYFESTKTATNDQIGAMGLGSKSPLSYAESFMITSWTDGMERIYSMFWNASDLPEVSLLSETPSDQPTGVKVTVQVKSQDFKAFSRAAKALTWFESVTPNVIADETTMISVMTSMRKPEIKLQGNGWMIVKIDRNALQRELMEEYEREMMDRHSGMAAGMGGFVRIGAPGHHFFDFIGRSHGGVSAYAKHGPVLYPIDMESLGSLDKDEQRVLTIEGLILDFPIGSLDVIASREGLSYKDKTITALRQAIAKFSLDFKKQVSEQISSAPNLWSAFSYLDGHCMELMRKHPKLASGALIYKIATGDASYREVDLMGILGSQHKETLEFDGPYLTLENARFGSPEDSLLLSQPFSIPAIEIERPKGKNGMVRISYKYSDKRYNADNDLETIFRVDPRTIKTVYLASDSEKDINKLIGAVVNRIDAESLRHLYGTVYAARDFMVVTGDAKIHEQVRKLLDGATFVNVSDLPACDVTKAERQFFEWLNPRKAQQPSAGVIDEAGNLDPRKQRKALNPNEVELPILDMVFKTQVSAAQSLAAIKARKEPCPVVIGNGGMYLHMSGNVAKHRGKEISVSRLCDSIGLAHNANLLNNRIFMLDDEQVKQVENHSKWRNVLDVIVDKSESIESKTKENYDLALYRFVRSASPTKSLPYYDDSVGGVKKYRELADESPFRIASDINQAAYSKYLSGQDFFIRAAARALEADDVYPFVSKYNTDKELTDMYPLLKHLKMTSKTVGDILDYVKMIDTQNGIVRPAPVEVPKTKKVAKKAKKS